MAANARNVARALRPTTKAGPGGARPTAAPQMGQPYIGGISPLALESQAGGGSWANAYGGFLPRRPEDFTQGAFGPFSPILPVPVDAPPSDDTPRAEPRRWQYEVGYNLPVGQPGSEGLKLADFGTLKTLADLYSVARACIQLRKNEVRGLEWDITPTKEAAKAMRGDKAAMKDFGERRGEAVKFFNHPDPDFFTWNTWMDALLEQVFVFDALALLLQPKWSRGTGKGLLGSDLDSLQLISGPTIRPLLDMRGGKPRPPAPAYQQYLYGVPRSDMMTVLTGRDLDESGLTGAQWAQFRGDQLLYMPMEARRETPYGFPPIERALIPVMAGLQKQAYQLDFFREGSVPAVYISPGGVNSDLTPNQIRELQDALNAIAGDPAYKHKILVLPADSRVMPQKPVEIADQFDEIVMNQVCMAFDIQPMELGIMPRVSTTSSPGAANQMAKSSADTHERKATKPLLKFLADIFDYILQDVCGQDDMQFTFEGLEQDEDEETLTTLVVTQIGAGLASIDEGREKLGRQPWNLPETSDPIWAPAGATPMPVAQIGQQPMMPGALAPGAPPGGAPGKPGTPGTAKPGNTGQSPGHDAAEASASAAGNGSSRRTAAQPQSKTPATSAQKAAQPATDEQQPAPEPPPQDSNALRDIAIAAAVALVLAKLRAMVRAYHGDRTAAAVALQGAVDAMAHGYGSVMDAASQHAVDEHGGVPQDFTGHAAMRAETQRAYLMGMLKTAAQADPDQDPEWLDSRTALYGKTLNAAYNEAYGQTVQANNPDYEIVWHLGESEHCPLCLARDGKSYTFDTLPGYPGDGGFGGADALCLGGPNCACVLEYKESGKPSLFAENTQRPESVQYYQDQLQTITAARAQSAQARTDFVESLPTTGAQARALNRDQIRRLLADEANAAIRAQGGYPGVSVEPADIPADLVIAHPTWMKSRAAQAELEALGRHLRKGRLISTWEPRNIPNDALARIAEHMAHGLDADAAINVVKATRRVTMSGEEYWDTAPEGADPDTAAGGGARVPGGSAGKAPGGEPAHGDSDGATAAPYMDMWPQGGIGTQQSGVSGATAGSVRGRPPNGVGKMAPDVAKVGPHGYIHGWIKVNPGGDSLQMHSDDKGNVKPERAKLHDQIVSGMLSGHEPKAKPTATFLGGGPASGKSTVMKDTESSAIIDADGIKGKLPEYQHMVEAKDPRAAMFAHEESSVIASKAMREAAKRKIDFTLDGTGDSSFEKLSRKVAQARTSGHSVAAKYVTVDTDEAVRRAMKRAARTGRMVPETTIREIHGSVSDTFKKGIDHDLFDTAELWDNNGSEPKLIGEKKAGGSWTVHDQGAWQRFLDKGGKS